MAQVPEWMRGQARAGRGIPAYSYALNNPIRFWDPNGLEVYICSRVADVPILGFLGLKHQWIRTDSTSAGLGPGGGGIPGHGGSDVPFSPTSINDHSGETEGMCQPAPFDDIDEDCVNQQLAIGRDMGPWDLFNNCQSFVHDVIVSCSRKAHAAEDQMFGMGL